MSLWRLWSLANPCPLVILDDQEFHIGKVILSFLLREMTGNEKSFVFIALEYAFFFSYHTCARSHSLDVISVLSRICIPFSGRALAISSKREMALIRSNLLFLGTFITGYLSTSNILTIYDNYVFVPWIFIIVFAFLL